MRGNGDYHAESARMGSTESVACTNWRPQGRDECVIVRGVTTVSPPPNASNPESGKKSDVVACMPELREHTRLPELRWVRTTLLCTNSTRPP